MTTDLIEVWSLEEGDTILIRGNLYLIHDIETLDSDHTSLLVLDEEGYAHTINVKDSQKISVVVLDNYASID
jgi:hypothetical protein